MSDVHPENLPPTLSREKTIELVRRFSDLFHWMTLEGIVDPRNGTNFEILQYDLDEVKYDPDSGRVEGPKKFVVDIGLPDDPIEDTLNKIALEINPKED